MGRIPSVRGKSKTEASRRVVATSRRNAANGAGSERIGSTLLATDNGEAPIEWTEIVPNRPDYLWPEFGSAILRAERNKGQTLRQVSRTLTERHSQELSS